ncbi:hypothetical protein L3Y34_015990 [Caenorhabditis briggsae]|nr:hypothetical protein L3Y34_015990 [Caenorhabditis briggsae]
MDKPKASKRATPSLRTKKKSTDRQKSTSRPSTQASKNSVSSNKQKKDPSQHSKKEKHPVANGRSVMVMDREPATDNNAEKNKKTPVKEVKKRSAEAEKKLDRTQEDVPKEDTKVGAENISNIEVLPDKNPAKMDDGYEDFGPGAAS